MTASKKTAVVTGASSGLGAVYADRLAARGYDLVLVARRADRLAALADKLSTTYGVNVRSLVADLEQEADVAKVEQVLTSDSSVQLLVNNAGLAKLRALAESSAEDARTQIALNIVALTRLTQAALPAFVSRDAGTIINVASVLAVHSWAISSVYSGTKSYVLAFSRGIQDELAKAHSKVKLQIVLPASTATEIWTEGVSGVPLSALGKDTVMSAEDCVDAALAGLDNGEAITWPSVEDETLWNQYATASATLFAATQTGTPASRYRIK
ncbi:SDR family NAD(P)-dependent oxidoreductase [Pseudomonas frederiksbergensis]|uniref:NADP-dependent 3-hydroxy acid dehydrogenase YdfG n=1 Tax=Pseudomonas frederiksbergensis TaxID=104087 RepID=A0A423KR51_9PSED|nr:SDR family NAD(P)-dependent oxidoreductase [Pseudomonas frederiksbergensis]RON57839.1 SDR family oxidoreductase [Pseudomonas frederiksbergensis]